MASSDDQHLTALDATFLELEEADAGAHMHIGAVMVFDPVPGGRAGAPPIDLVRAELAARLPDLPRFGQRLSERQTHGLSWPRWVDDEHFDISRHVRRAALPDHAGEAELREWAGGFYSQRLDRSHPLWEIAILDLADGGWAMATKTHHCMVDGVGSVEIGHMILDLEPNPDRSREAPAPAETAEPPQPARRGARRASRRLLALPLAVASAGLSAAELGIVTARRVLRLAEAGAGTLIHPERAREALRRSRALAELLIRDELIAAPRTSLNRPIGPRRRLAVVSAELDDVKAIKRALGGTVNDVVLAATAGGLRRLLGDRGEALPPQGLRAMVPVNIRAAADRLGTGNRITSLFVHLPLTEPDPVHRYRLQLEEAESLKAGTQALGSSTVIDVTSLAPPILHTFLARSLYATRLFNLTITNIPGPQQPLYSFGSRMRAAWPLVPLAAEHALALAVVSYDGRLFFCFNADRETVPDLDVAAEGLIAELAALREAAASADRDDPAEPPDRRSSRAAAS
ncbi:MAG TPA: wax ester/triacylglycerol synthase family O-acyltransferase [Solirubrobacterales bacterium]|nr:wax ester/triacylglycerol synthase family O-acyltransferase [Solirubrobacterales bacterium]